MYLARYWRRARRPSRLRESHNTRLPARPASRFLSFLDEARQCINPATAGAFKCEVGRDNYQQHPQHIGYKEMGDLEPNRSEKQYIRDAHTDLHQDRDE